jgi:hypothetical protein
MECGSWAIRFRTTRNGPGYWKTEAGRKLNPILGIHPAIRLTTTRRSSLRNASVAIHRAGIPAASERSKGGRSERQRGIPNGPTVSFPQAPAAVCFLLRLSIRARRDRARGCGVRRRDRYGQRFQLHCRGAALGKPDESEDDGASRRFDVELFIVHPSIDPAAISAALGLEGHIAHAAGADRVSSKGIALPGQYPDTRWRHSVRHTVTHHWFALALAEFVDRLMLRKAFLHHVRATGGQATVVVQFFNDGYLGDQLKSDTLAKLAQLRVDFGIECFV